MGLEQSRECRLTYRVMVWAVLAMGILTNVAARGVFGLCRRFYVKVNTPTRSALRKARQHLGSKPVRELFSRVVQPVCRPEVLGGFCKKFRMMAIDGRLYTIPDTPENARAFGTEPRRNRINPRVIQRARCKWPAKKPDDSNKCLRKPLRGGYRSPNSTVLG